MQGHEEIDYSKKLDVSLWKRLLHIAGPFHKHLWLVVLTMGICAVCDVIFPQLTGYAIDHFIAKRTTAGMGGFIGIYLGVLVVQVICIYAFLYLSGKIEVGVCYLIRKQGFQKLPDLYALKDEYKLLAEQKDQLQWQYNDAKRQMQEYDIIKQNVDGVLFPNHRQERNKTL